jgi:6-phosphogluconolactonase (cycloisomerase 2 family)
MPFEHRTRPTRLQSLRWIFMGVMLLVPVLLAAACRPMNPPDEPPTNQSPTRGATRYVYVANSWDQTIGIYSVELDTRLTPRGYVRTAPGPARALLMVNQWLFAAAGSIVQYAVDPVSGQLSLLRSVAAGTDPAAMVFTNGRLYVANYGSHTVSVFSVDQNGVPTLEHTVSVEFWPKTLAVDDDGRHLFVGHSNPISSYLCTHIIQVNGSVGNPGCSRAATMPEAMLYSNRVLYIANAAENSVSAYDFDPAQSLVTRRDTNPTTPGVQDLQVGVAPGSLAVSRDRRTLWVSRTGGTTLVDTISFTAVGTAQGSALAGDSLLDDSGQTLYFADPTSNEIVTMAVGAGNALTRKSATPSRGAPVAMAMTVGGFRPTYSARLALSGGGNPAAGPDNGVRSYLVDSSSGALTEKARVAGLFVNSLALHPHLPVAYAVGDDTSSAGALWTYQLGLAATDGSVTQTGSPSPTGAQPRSVLVEPSGRFAYVIHASANPTHMIWSFTVDPTTGALTRVPGVTALQGIEPSTALIDPLGQYLYVAYRTSSNVGAHRINPATGALDTVPGAPFGVPTAIGRPSTLGAHPWLSALYVGGDSGTVAFSIQRRTGAIAQHGGFVTNAFLGLLPTASGACLLDCGISNVLGAMRIDVPAGGSLAFPSSGGGDTGKVGVGIVRDDAGKFALSLVTESPQISKIITTSTDPCTSSLTSRRGPDVPATSAARAIALRNVVR